MRVMVLTQEDVFFLPTNVEKLARVADVVEVVIVDSKGSLKNMGKEFYLWFGPIQVTKMGLMYATRRLMAALDPLFGWHLLGGKGSLRSLTKKMEIPNRVITNVNSKEFVEHVDSIAPDLIVSYSAPQVIREPLLSMPKYGIINVHGSLLPDFRGLLPSFWVLYKGEDHTGATVHYMSTKIDDGKIILQAQVPLDGVNSMFEVMQKTKRLGGELVVQAVRLIEEGRVNARDNDTTQGGYFSWPTRTETREFRAKGLRLV